MKKIGIMQPYFLPYIGYWQLINLVDEYIVYDDVNYIKRGWINRNRIYYSNSIRYINIPILATSQNKRINELVMSDDKNQYQRLVNIVSMAYKSAPFYNTVLPILEKIVLCPEKKAVYYLLNSIETICDYLDIKTKLFLSSDIEKNNYYKGEEKIIDICARRGANCYVNAIGGRSLYHADKFREKGMELKFIQVKEEEIRYSQLSDEYYPNLSILDVMMFNDKKRIQYFLQQYCLI